MLKKVRLSSDETEIVNECFRTMVHYYQRPSRETKRTMQEAHARVQVAALIKAGVDINRLVTPSALHSLTNGRVPARRGKKTPSPSEP